jgi:hypothetical protein
MWELRFPQVVFGEQPSEKKEQKTKEIVPQKDQ